MCGVSYILSRESLRSCKTRFDAWQNAARARAYRRQNRRVGSRTRRCLNARPLTRERRVFSL